MTLFDFLGDPAVQPFSVAAVVILLLLVVELGGLLLAGTSLGATLDNWFGLHHDAAADTAGLDNPADLDHGSSLGDALAWLNIGRLPTLVVIILLFGGFACFGIGLQGLALQAGGALVSPWVMALPALIGAGLTSHWLGGRIARLVPREESYAIRPDELIGSIARLSIGPVDQATAGRALVTDANGNRHNVRVLAGSAGQRFESGASVLLATRQDGLFLITAVPDGMSQPLKRE